MSINFRSNVLDAIRIAIVNFVILSILEKLLLGNEEWLSFSMMWSAFWAIGRLIAAELNETKTQALKKLIVFIVVAVVSFAFIIFLTVMVFKLPNLSSLMLQTFIPLNVSMVTCDLLNQSFKKNDET